MHDFLNDDIPWSALVELLSGFMYHLAERSANSRIKAIYFVISEEEILEATTFPIVKSEAKWRYWFCVGKSQRDSKGFKNVPCGDGIIHLWRICCDLLRDEPFQDMDEIVACLEIARSFIDLLERSYRLLSLETRNISDSLTPGLDYQSFTLTIQTTSTPKIDLNYQCAINCRKTALFEIITSHQWSHATNQMPPPKTE